MSDTWYSNQASLRAAGYSGFITIRSLREKKCEQVPGEDGDQGVYVVLREVDTRPVFLRTSTGGWFKKRDPSVSQAELDSNWVDGAVVMYVGKAGGSRSRATLRSRLKQYLAFGDGKTVGHWGGRLLWHLPEPDTLVICWRQTPDEEPRDVESEMIREFKGAHGQRPFANLAD